MDTKININYTNKGDILENSIIFDIKGDKENGLNKSIVNSIRRVILSSIPTVGFRTEMDNTDIKIIKNTTSLHNEFLLHRISMIPLYIDPSTYKRNYLFKLTVENDSTKPITKITCNDFEIFPIKEDVIPEDDNIDLKNYLLDKPLSDKEKKNIFRPFQDKHYCLITELKSSKSSMKEELELYGVPRISYAYENAKWQSASCSSYSFKKDEDLFQKILNEKILIDKISEEDKYNYSKALYLSESERYFHRDKNAQPYWYEFKLDSTHYLSSKQLFIQANDLLIEQLDLFKKDLPKLTTQDNSRFTLEKDSNIYKITIHGLDDTIGNILQTYISDDIINQDTSTFLVCGYKRTHPLEEIVQFNISLNPTLETSNQKDIQLIIELFLKASNDLIHILSLIKEEAENNL